MKKAIINRTKWLVVLITCTLFGVTNAHAQNLWASLASKPTITPAHKTPQRPHSPTNPPLIDSSREQLTVIAYHENHAQLTTVATSHVYGRDPALLHSATLQAVNTVDALTGNPLVHYHGQNNQDKITYRYDGLNRKVYSMNLEHGLHGLVHKTRQQVTYTLQNGKSTVTVAQLDNLNSNGTPYTTTTQSNLSETRNWDNMPEHGETANNPAQITLRNDLGESYQTIVLPRSDGEFNSKQSRVFDAKGRAVSTTVDNALDPTLLPAAQLQRITHQNRIDDVDNTVTTQTIAGFYNIDSNTKKCTVIGKSVTTGSTVKTLNDQQQVIQAQLENHNASLLSNTSTQYDNFGLTVHQAVLANATKNGATAVNASNQFNALGAMQSSKLGNDGDKTQVRVTFYHDDLSDPNKVTSKKVSVGTDSETRYRYIDGLQGTVVAEYRGDVTGSQGGQMLEQTYDASQDGGYTVVKSAWHVVGAGTTNTDKTTNYYGDVNNKRQLLQQVVDNGKEIINTTWVYDYTTGLLIGERKQATGEPTTRTLRTYRADGKPLTVSVDDGLGGAMKTLRYDYTTYDPSKDYRNNILNLDKLASRTDFSGLETDYLYNGDNLYRQSISSASAVGEIASISQRVDPLGNVIQRERVANNRGAPKKLDIELLTYDPTTQRVTDITYQDSVAITGDAVVGKLHYDYNNATGNITHKTESTNDGNETTSDYAYQNNSNQLYSSQVTPDPSSDPLSHPIVKTTYHKDALGNITAIHMDHPPAGTPVDRHFHYDDSNALKKVNTLDRFRGEDGMGIQYDAQGNLTTDGAGDTFTWNAANQEKTYRNQQGDFTTYTYPTYGRTKSQADHDGTLTKLDYFYLDGQLLNTFETAGKHDGDKSAYLGRDFRLILDKNNKLIQLQALRADNSGTMKSTLTLRINAATGELTAQGTHYQYDSEGTQQLDAKQPLDSNKLTILYQPLRFNGDLHDQETNPADQKQARIMGGTDYKLARSVIHLDGVTRFMSEDYGMPLMNLYLLDKGNKNAYRDAGGHNARGAWNSFTSWVSNAWQSVSNFASTPTGIGMLVGVGIAAVAAVEAIRCWRIARDFSIARERFFSLAQGFEEVVSDEDTNKFFIDQLKARGMQNQVLENLNSIDHYYFNEEGALNTKIDQSIKETFSERNNKYANNAYTNVKRRLEEESITDKTFYSRQVAWRKAMCKMKEENPNIFKNTLYRKNKILKWRNMFVFRPSDAIS